MGAASAITLKAEEHLPCQYNLPPCREAIRPTIALNKVYHIFNNKMIQQYLNEIKVM